MYVDTSCLGSYYIEEVHSQSVQNLLLNDESPNFKFTYRSRIPLDAE